MTTLVERVARALALMKCHPSKLTDSMVKSHMPAARAAISAMREPTEAVWMGAAPIEISAIDSVTWAVRTEAVFVDARALWNGMIDAALNEKDSA